MMLRRSTAAAAARVATEPPRAPRGGKEDRPRREGDRDDDDDDDCGLAMDGDDARARVVRAADARGATPARAIANEDAIVSRFAAIVDARAELATG
jgi:hypothetical protein